MLNGLWAQEFFQEVVNEAKGRFNSYFVEINNFFIISQFISSSIKLHPLCWDLILNSCICEFSLQWHPAITNPAITKTPL